MGRGRMPTGGGAWVGQTWGATWRMGLALFAPVRVEAQEPVGSWASATGGGCVRLEPGDGDPLELGHGDCR